MSKFGRPWLPANDAPTKGKWRARPMDGGRGVGRLGYVIEAEIPCINGLLAWFQVACIYERDDEERLMTDGRIAGAKTDAEAIVDAMNGYIRSQPTTPPNSSNLRDFTTEQLGEEIQWRRYHATNAEKE